MPQITNKTETKKTEEKIDTSNIFSEFTDDSGLKSEVEKIIQEQNKDVYYYLHKIGDYLKSISWILLIGLIFVYGYIYIQENEEITNNNILDPFCIIILGDIENDSAFCSSIAALEKQYNLKINEIKNNQLAKINEIIQKLYEVENFSKTKEVIFLKDKTENRLPVLEIIGEFDDLKNNFEPIQRQKVECFDIEITSDYVFKARCNAYSTEFDKQIKGFDGTDNNLVGGRSISYANSFLNYIEKKSDKFTHISRQKVFTSTSVSGEHVSYTNMTTFYLELKYNSDNLSL